MFAFAEPEQSEALHEGMLGIEEEIFEASASRTGVVDIGTGDLGGAAYRQVRPEAWMPGRGAYGEITSPPTPRLPGPPAADPLPQRQQAVPQLLHTLNGTP
jgi:seryl-tRNA synthetase